MTTRKTLTRLPAIVCPHCDSKAIVRNSADVTKMIREIRLECTNDDCQHTFVGQLSVIRTIRPSLMPRADVRLPFANPNLIGPRSKPANDDEPQHANENSDDTGVIGALIAALTT